MNERLSKIVKFWPIIVTVCSVIFFIFGYILSIRSDLNATEFQVQALQQSTAPITQLIPEVAAIKQASVDTNEKVNVIYSKLVK